MVVIWDGLDFRNTRLSDYEYLEVGYNVRGENWAPAHLSRGEYPACCCRRTMAMEKAGAGCGDGL